MANRSDGSAAAASGLGQAAAEWASSRWVEVDGSRVRYREAGSGRPIVLVHGLGVSADYWVRNGPALAAAGARVLAPDLPGFGRTAGPSDGLSVAAQAEALYRWSRVLALPPAVYVGHSLSCQTVVELAVIHPEIVRGLVLAAPTGKGKPLWRLIDQAFGLLRDIRRESLKLAALVLEAYLQAGPALVFRTWKLGAQHDILPLLPRVQVPTLVILGDRDPVVDLEFAEQIVATTPTAKLVRIASSAHAVIFDPTGEFNREVRGFVDGIGEGTAGC
jgi:pimeloyl-ACP methyl ester carboxylesterase